MGPPRRHQGRSRVPQVGGAAPRCGQTSCASRRPWPAGRRAWAMSTHLALRPHSPPHAGDQETLQPHPGGDLPLQLAPPPDQQPHLLHRGAGKAPGTWAREGVAQPRAHFPAAPSLPTGASSCQSRDRDSGRGLHPISPEHLGRWGPCSLPRAQDSGPAPLGPGAGAMQEWRVDGCREAAARCWAVPGAASAHRCPTTRPCPPSTSATGKTASASAAASRPGPGSTVRPLGSAGTGTALGGQSSPPAGLPEGPRTNLRSRARLGWAPGSEGPPPLIGPVAPPLQGTRCQLYWTARPRSPS